MKKKIAVAITGASGTAYGVEVVKGLVALEHEVVLILSDAGKEVLLGECGLTEEDLLQSGVTRYEDHNISAPIASGSYPLDGMVIVPCTMASLAGVATGLADSLIFRAADVCLKEGRPLILVPRETPLNRIHIQNMLRAHDAGAVVMPAMPPLYGKPASVEELVSHMAGRILDRLGIQNNLAPRWKGS